MFLMTLFNGYSGFDIANIHQVIKVNDLFIVDYNRFQNQVKLCEVNDTVLIPVPCIYHKA